MSLKTFSFMFFLYLQLFSVLEAQNKFSIPASLAEGIHSENPFKGGTFVSLKVYDVLGREVATLVNEEKLPGNYEVKFSVETLHATSLPSGIYFYRLQAGSFSEIKKMILLK